VTLGLCFIHDVNYFHPAQFQHIGNQAAMTAPP
jgi:hypothetical protein